MLTIAARQHDPNLSPAMRDDLLVMQRNVELEVKLIDDLLDISRITQGKLRLTKEKVELRVVANRAAESARPLMDARQHDFSVSLPTTPVWVEADPARLEQVVVNLLNNAAKYTDRGGRIEVSVRPGPSHVEVRISDDGIGIPAAMLERIFGIFTQVERSLEKARGGLGIGLSIARRLVEMHGGTIVARSEGPGHGSEFIVTLPIAEHAQAVNAAESPDERRKNLRQRRVLIADDNIDSASSLCLMLQVMGNEVRVAHDGLEALAVAESYRPDAVLLDIGMPGLNGYEVCRKLRERPATQDAMIIALTGWGQEDDRRRSKEFGFDQHLVKPVEPRTLEGLLASLGPN